ncbi:DUF427-domain-containing protein [Panus rudis PR-1116 ss-1]|nr:DUF427-domain-containing protein [Panus rudis PR-1116 ss-1]
MAPSFFPLPHVEDSKKRVRVLFGGKYIVDTKQSKLVWIKPFYPLYFFNSDEIPSSYLTESLRSDEHIIYDLAVGNRIAERSVKKYLTGDLKGLINIEFSAADAWFEEDDQIFVHPKDPYKRVDVLQSSRHIRVELNGVELANTTKPRLLFETGLPVRTYIPKTDVRMDLLVPSQTTTKCPYKGTASYYNVKLPDGSGADDIVWWYPVALPECDQVKGFAAFYDEKVDVYVDGELQKRPGKLA